MFAMTKSFENRSKNMIFNQLNTKHHEKKPFIPIPAMVSRPVDDAAR